MRSLQLLWVVLIMTLAFTNVNGQNIKHTTKSGVLLQQVKEPPTVIYNDTYKGPLLPKKLLNDYLHLKSNNGVLKNGMERRNFHYTYFIFAISGEKVHQEWIVKNGVITEWKAVSQPIVLPAIWMILAALGIVLMLLTHQLRHRVLVTIAAALATVIAVFAAFITIFVVTIVATTTVHVIVSAVVTIVAIVATIFAAAIAANSVHCARNTIVYISCMIMYVVLLYFAL